MKLKTWLGMALVALAAGMASADGLEVSAYWQDHMVLQRGKKITVWGKDAAGRRVTVSFANQAATATTDADGYWETTFAQPFDPSSSAQTLTISDDGNESLSISDVLVGDVFLAAGQSNMDRRLEDKAKSNFEEPQSIKDFCRDDDGIRFLRIARSAENATSGEQLFDLPPLKAVNDTVKYYGEGYDWSPATGTNRNYVSSVALNFARYVRDANAARGENIPIGIVHASSGGTYIREWIAPSVLIDNGIDSPGSAASSDGWFWNNMMAPILRAKFRAVLWYQGCSDAQRSVADYKKLMDVLVKDRRDRWGDGGDLPFYAVQIATPGYSQSAGTVGLDQYPAPTEDDVGHNYVRVREAQRLWDASDAGAHGLVTTVDCVPCLGANDLHPVDKNFIGRRLSLFARRDIYGETDLQAEGPAFTRAVREADGSVRVFFKSGTAKGLTAGRVKPASSVAVSRWVKKGTDPIRGFALCGANGAWQDAEATVEGETVVLRAAGVATPTQFHYGYWCITRSTDLEDGQRLNLYNGDGLPMSPVAPQAVEDPDASTKVADPVLLPASCLFSPSTNVTIACATSGATVRYTLDGTDPTASSTEYTGPIAISATTTVKARAFAADKEASDVVFATYTLGEPPAAEPDPLWEPGMYKFDEWTPLANNLLAGLTTAYTANSLDPWNGSVVCLTDETVSSNLDDAAVGIGIRDGATLSWSFAAPKTIETIRLTACGYNHIYKYDKILVESVEVLQDGEWNQIGGKVAFNGPDSYGSDQSLYATLADEVTGHLATNVTGLRITFGNPKALGKCRYAEIEASGYDSSGGPTETVATPAFDPAACSFFPSTNVALSCATLGATIRYTLDGSNPTSLSTEYTAPIELSATTTIKARAYAEGMDPSGIASATYTLVDPSTPPDDPTATTNGMWIASSCAPANWTALANNLLAGKSGTISGATAGDSYASRDPALLTDSSVPTAGGTAWIVGFQNNASISWTFETPKTLERVRISCGYLADKSYSGFTVSSVEVQTSGSTEWTTVNTAAGQMAATSQAEILCLVLADGSGAPLAENVGALRVTFGTPPAGFANYCAEIEAVGTASGTEPLETVATPTFDPVACSFYPSTNVTLSCATANATIRYTLDGSDPTAESTAYEAPIALAGTTTIKARAFATDMNPSAVASATYTLFDPGAPGYDITIAACQNGTLETSATNDVAAGTIVTVTATPAAGYRLASVTTNGAALAGTTFAMPAEDVTVAATFEEQGAPTQMFYIGETGYDSWTDAYGAAKDGDTITVGANATMVVNNEGKTLTIDLAGRALEWAAGSWMFGTRTVIDSLGGGQLTLASGSRNVNQGTVDLSSLTADQLDGTGTFWTGATTVVKFPSGMALADCTSKIGNKSAAAAGQRIVVQGGTYTWDGSSWVPEGHDITIEAPQNGTLETSATNNVSAGTVVTVTATPAAGYELASVTTNGAALAGATFEMPAEDVTVAATFAEKAVPTHMFYIGDTGYDSWTNAFKAAKAGDTIVVGANAVIDHPYVAGTINKSVTIDLCGRPLDFAQGWLTSCTVTIVDTGTPAGSGQFELLSSGMNVSGDTLDLSALSGSQLSGAGKLQMSATSLVIFPHDLSLAYSTPFVRFDGADPEHGVGARIVVRGVTYTWNGTDWGVTFRITSIAVDDEFVELGVLVAPEYGFDGTVTILGSETVNGTYHVCPDATTDDGVLYRVPVSDDRFFKAALGL